ncbi:complement C1q tumor necrosis factor-related protein 3-like [Daphnia pulex]|uniref:complement C1q tumor necrosis factor-related protein 3-like n=2 Tax=Daphnia TaxID=6668 RepID=UPI001EE04CC7|nr:complement C1q tumor necrosis factor-related protein 3-like [Daphnia pulex]
MGHIWSGIYSVMGSSMVENVYCDFTKLPSEAGFQQWIGFVDVKSVPNYFYGQLNGDFTTPDTPIPFRKIFLNVGGGMNETTGIFTAPVNGKYFFSLSGIVQIVGSPNSPDPTTPRPKDFILYMFKNGVIIGSSYTDESNLSTQFENYSLQSTLDLITGDQIWLEIANSSSIGYVYMYSGCHFTVFLMEQTEIFQLLVL